MVKILRHSQMKQGMTVNVCSDRNMVLENSLGLMEVLTLVTSKKTIFKEMENIALLMVECLKDLGTTIKWKVKESSHGLTVEDTKEIIKMIRKKAMVPFIILMEESMMVAGKMESNMALELILLQMANRNKENGKKEKDFIGFQAMVFNND